MRRRRGSSLSVLWDLIKPIALYYIGYYLTYFILLGLLSGRGIMGISEDMTAIAGGICMLGGCGALLFMIQDERELQEEEKKKGERKAGKNPLYFLLLAVYALSAVLFFNMTVDYLGLAEASESFQKTAESQYAVSLGMGLLLYGVISAVVEEVIFRFLLYNRLKRAGRIVYGVVASSFLFGAYHGNIVQGIYGFVLGVLLAFSYIYFGNFLAPVLFHGIGNAVIFICGMEPDVYRMFFNPVGFVIYGLVLIFVSLFAYKDYRKGKIAANTIETEA